jgi:hypothetical protein
MITTASTFRIWSGETIVFNNSFQFFLVQIKTAASLRSYPQASNSLAPFT